jgi:uncharacterized membrane protein YgdD (TMEM256/DUF423 family)
MSTFFLKSGTIFGALGVMIGAFGAHALKDLLETTGRTATFETAVKYQMYHALTLLALGLVIAFFKPQKAFTVAGYAFIGGILIFSGTLYMLCLTGITWLGAITPIGGVLLITGWISMLVGLFKPGNSIRTSL